MLLRPFVNQLRGRLQRDLTVKRSRYQHNATNKTAAVITLNSKSVVDRFLDSYDTFIFDCDGVLWQTDHVTPLPNIDRAIHKLHALNKKVVYVTNNSILSRKQLQEKFTRYGFDADYDTIYGNAYASAVYLKDIAKINGKVYVVGGKGLQAELDQVGLENFGVGPDPDRPSWKVSDMLKMHFEDNVKAVAVGFDEHINFNKIYKAASYLQDPNCQFVATNWMHKGVTIGNNRRQPATGTFISAIRGVSNREPVVVGKPERLLFDCVMVKHPEIDKSRSVYIGDSLRADIGFAKTIGIDSVFVLTGADTLEQLKDLPHLTPSFVLPALGDIA